MSRRRRSFIANAFARLTCSAFAVAAASCQSALGEECSTTSECEAALECVRLDDGNGWCVPRATERAPRACADDNPCDDARGVLWPLEAACGDGACRCEVNAFDCAVDGADSVDPGEVVVDPATCVCRRRDASGEPCFDQTCAAGLSCGPEGTCG